MAVDDASDFKSDKYTIHRTLVSIAVLLASFMIAWLKGWKESIELCDTPDVNVFAIFMKFGIALASTVTIVFAAGIFLFVVEVVFVNVLKYRGKEQMLTDINAMASQGVGDLVNTMVKDVSLGFIILTEWLMNWRIVTMFIIAIAIAAAFAQGVLLLVYMVRSESTISSLEYRQAVNLIYSFLLIIVISALLLQTWCSAQRW
jgi:hypothetical protein